MKRKAWWNLKATTIPECRAMLRRVRWYLSHWPLPQFGPSLHSLAAMLADVEKALAKVKS